MTLWESVYNDKPVRLIEKDGIILAEEASERDPMYRPCGWHKIEGIWPEPVQKAYNEITKTTE